MQTKQTIAIIGATGNMGSAISKSISKGNYRLLLKGSKVEELQVLAEDIRTAAPSAEVEAVACPAEAS